MGDVGIPDRMQIVVGAGLPEAYFDLVTPPISILGMQRLMDVADEMEQIAKGFFARQAARVGRDEEGGLVGDGGDDTSFVLGATVLWVLYGARCWRGVTGIYCILFNFISLFTYIDIYSYASICHVLKKKKKMKKKNEKKGI